MCKKSLLCMIWAIFLSYEEAFATDNNHKLPVNSCGEMDCFFGELISCKERCGCDKSIPYRFNITTGECVLNFKTLILSLAEKHKTQEKNRKRTERIYHRIMISGILVITCASFCLFSACFYCVRMKYTDHQLRKCVKEVSKKLKAHPMVNKTKQYLEKHEDSDNNEAIRKGTAVV